jgi:hypothetical protein
MSRRKSNANHSSQAAKDRLLEPALPAGQSIKVIGLGGTGGIVARYGAMFLAPLAKQHGARMVFVDGDAFEPGNATRMFFSDCGNKAAVVLADLRPRFADSGLTLQAIEEFVTPENVGRLIHNGDIVLLCVDNHATRKLVSDHCAKLDDVVLISGGNDGVGEDGSGRLHRGTYGNCQIYVRRDGRDCSPSLTKYHVEIEEPADRLPTDLSCTDLVSSVPQLLLANLAAASSLLNATWLYLSGGLSYSELAFDIAEGLMRPLPLPAPQLEASEPKARRPRRPR